jgi:hypothetical protein
MFGLPLTVIDVGTSGLERELELLVCDQGGGAGGAGGGDTGVGGTGGSSTGGGR